MEVFAGISVLFLILVAAAVAIKTFSLWLRTRGLPELLLTLYLTCATVTGYPLAIAMTRIPASENWFIHVLAEVVMSCGWVCLLLFTLRVFRPHAAWARWLVGACLAVVASTGALYILEALSENPRPPETMPLFVVINSLPVAIAYFWTTFESIHYHGQLKLRLRLGLAEPTVVNRMLLWGLMSFAAGTALVINMVMLVAMGSYLSPVVVMVSSALGVVHASCLFLAFHPPAWYGGWLERKAAVQGA